MEALVPDKKMGWVRAVATSMGEETEVLLNDELADKLGVNSEEGGEGIWRLAGEPRGARRTSAESELWMARDTTKRNIKRGTHIEPTVPVAKHG